MSITDADLIESLLIHQVTCHGRIDVLEWGSGRSTQSFTSALHRTNLPFHWVTLEHDREFFDRTVLEGFHDELPVDVRYPDSGRERRRGPAQGRGAITAIVFERGEVRPDIDGRERDRTVDLDHYVEYPSTLGKQFDVILVDGRKRRRCLVEAARLLQYRGFTLLHDAQRAYYHCAFDQYASHDFIGDELWVGALNPRALAKPPIATITT